MGKHSEQMYVVKEIIDRRDERLPNGRVNTFYKVLWQGYPESEATWENAQRLYRHGQIKKDIKIFNEKRNAIKKQEKISQHKTLNKSTITKNTTQAQQSPKLNKSEVFKNIPEPMVLEKQSKSPQNKQTKQDNVSRKEKGGPHDDKNNKVVEKILSKMRKNTEQAKTSSLELSKSNVEMTQSEKKIMKKVKEKVSNMPSNKKQIPDNETKAKSQRTQSKKGGSLEISLENIGLQKTKSVDQIEPKLQKTKSVDQIEPKSPVPMKESRAATELPSFEKSSDKTQILESIEEEKSAITQLIKPVEQNDAVIENIKLQLVDELSQNDVAAIGGNKSKTFSNEQTGQKNEEEFDIKGMLVSKNEYYYLVEENGKSQIITRADILNSHPYELICFYERRINIRPAEVNLMIL